MERLHNLEKPYFRRTSNEVMRVIDRFCTYHDMLQGKMAIPLDKGTVKGPRDVFQEAFVREYLLPIEESYGHEAGADKLREKIAEVENRKHATSYTSENVAIIPGAWAGVVLAIEETMGLKGGRYDGSHVAVIGPTLYQMFQRPIRDYGMEVIAYDYVLSFRPHIPMSMEDMEEVFAEKPRTIVISNPNNPDGVFFHSELLQSVIERAGGEDIFVVLDEMQNCFTREGASLGYSSWIEQPHVIRIDSPSKRWGLAQDRVGWIIAHKDTLGDRRRGIIGRTSSFIANAPKRLDTVLPMLLDPAGQSPEFQKEVEELLRKKEEELRQKEQYVRERLASIPSVKDVYPRDGCVNVAFKVAFSEDDDLELARRLIEHRTLIMPASGYGYNPEDNVLRITFTEDISRIERGLKTLETVLRQQRH